MLLGTLRISLFGNLLIGKVHFSAGEGPIRKLHVPVATFSTQDNAKILIIEIKFWNKDQLKKYQWKTTIQERNRYLDYLINSSFQEVNRLFVLSIENTTSGTSY